MTYAPPELVLQRADAHRRLHAALYRHLQRAAVLLEQEVPPLWCSSSNHKHSHGDVNGEAATIKKSEFSHNKLKTCNLYMKVPTKSS